MATAVAVTSIAVPAAVAPRPYFTARAGAFSQQKTPPCKSPLAKVDLGEHFDLITSTVKSSESCSASQNKLHDLLSRASILMTSLRNHHRAGLSYQDSSCTKSSCSPMAVDYRPTGQNEDVPSDLTLDQISNYYAFNTNQIILSSSERYDPAPPSYDEALSDVPPDYNDTNALAVADYKHILPLTTSPPSPPLPPPYECCAAPTHLLTSSISAIKPLLDPILPSQKIDLSALTAEESYRTRGKKKKGKQGGQTDWFDNEEGNGNGNNNGTNPGGGNGDGQNDGGDAAGGAGDGGDGGKGGGGDDDDDGFMAAGNKKNKKKNKKNKKNEVDGEEEGNKETWGYEAQQDPATVADSMWSDPLKTAEADPVDEWNTFEPVGGSKKKNAKKNAKKTANAFDSIPDSLAGAGAGTKNESNFDEVNLDDNVPHINLNFGSNDNNTNNFDIGAIGSGWASKPTDAWGTTKTGGSTWDFGALSGDTGLANKEDPLTDPVANNNIWQTGGTKKGNKSKNPFSDDIDNSFDFGFGNVANNQQVDIDYNDNQDPLNEDPGFTLAASKGKKKGKKSGITTTSTDPPGLFEKEDEEMGSHSAWTTTSDTKKKKKDKKKSGSASASIFEEEAAPPIPPPPPAIPPGGAEDMFGTNTDDAAWSTFDTGKKGKKNKKAKDDLLKPEDSVALAGTANEDAAAPGDNFTGDDWTGGWGTAVTKGNKKKGKDKQGSLAADLLNDSVDDKGSTNTFSSSFDPVDGAFGAIGGTKTKGSKLGDGKKKKSGGWASNLHEENFWGDATDDLLAADDPTNNDSLNMNGIDGDLMDIIDNNDDGKKKNKKKSILAEETQTTAEPDGMSASNDFGSWGTGSKKDKKGKKAKSGTSNLDPPPVSNVDDNKYEWGSADFFDNFDSIKKKPGTDDNEKDKKKTKDSGKSKKSKKDTEADVGVVQPDVVDEAGKDEFSSLLGFGKNGKKKDSKRNNPVEVIGDGDAAFTVQPDAIETRSAIEEDLEFSGFTSAKKGKKGKKGKESTPPLPAAPMPPGDIDTFEPELPPADEQPSHEPDDLWGYATGKKDKKKKNSKATEGADTVKKTSKELKKEKEEDLFKEEPEKQVAIEDPGAKPKKSNIWDTKDEEISTVKSAAPKTKKEREKEKKEKEKERKEKEKEELEKAKKEAEEAEEILKAGNKLEGDPNEIVDFVDESTPKEKKKKKSKKESEAKANDAIEAVEDTKSKGTKKGQKDFKGDSKEIIDLDGEGTGKDTKDKKKKKKDEKISSKSSKKTDDDKTKSKNEEESFALGDEDEAGEADDVGTKESKKDSPKPKKEEVKQSDGWSFWGLKNTAKKDKDKDASPRKELEAVTKNDDLATAGEAKASDPAPPHKSSAPSSPPTSKSAKSKASAKGAVADRIKAFQGDKATFTSLETSNKAAAADRSAADAADPLADILDTSSKPTSALITSKKAAGSSKTKSSKKKEGKDAVTSGGAADPAQDQLLIDIPDAPTPVPGGFPEDAMDSKDKSGELSAKDKKKDKKSDKKSDKAAKKDVKTSRSAKTEKSSDKSPDVAVDVPLDDAEAKSKKTSSKELKKSKESKEPKSKKEAAVVDDDAKMLPTPPPEPKPVKKERARVVRDQNSWGFWGAAPKTEAKKKAIRDDTAGGEEQPPAPRISRSKSARKASDRDPHKSPQSSGSEAKPVKVESKPKTSRGMSLSNMFGAPPPPSRSKSHRYSTATPKSRSRRPSMDDYGKLPTPPLDGRDELKVSAKAAKVMGIGGGRTSGSKRQSVKGKSRAVPDPYAIDDDDDIVMVDAADTGAQDSAVPPAEPEPSTKPRSSKSKSKGVSRGDKITSSSTEDAVLVDHVGPQSGNNADEMDIPSPQRSLKRSSTKRMPTSTKDVAGGFMSLFGGFRKKERERRLSDEDEDSSGRRKRTSGGQGSGTGDEEVRRSRGDGRDRRRSHKVNDADGNITDGARRSTDAEDVDARRAQRRARRAEKEAAGDVTETDNRAARRKDKERDRDRAAYEAKKARAAESREKRARQEEEYETRRAEERRARRTARDAEAKEADARDAERRARRRERLKERETTTAAGGAGGVTATEERPRSKPSDRDRYRSYNDKTRAAADSDQARRLKHEERRLKRSSTAAGVPEKLTRRRTAPIEDYFDSRNGRNHRRKTSDNSRSSGEKAGRPYLPTGKDKTSSWVNSVNASPPLPPPVEGTVLDPPPNRGAPANHDDEDDARRERRARRRAEREKERRPDEKVRQRRSSDDSGGPPPDRLSRRRTYHAPPPMDKRGSWLQKIRGF